MLLSRVKPLLALMSATVLLSQPLTPFAAPPNSPPQATPIFAHKVQAQALFDEVEALGSLMANESVELSASVTERVVAIHFEDGQEVKKGQLLVELDASEERALLAEERSIKEEAQRLVNRLRPLVEDGAVSPSVLDEAELELLTSTSRLRALQSQLDERVIKAPFAGHVGLRSISVGAMLQPGTLITTLDDTHIMKLDFSVPEVYLPALKKGNEIIAKAKAYPDEVFTGTISSIDSRVDSITRSIAVRALINNEEGLLKPGMFLRVQLKNNPRNALTIPEESILSRADKSFVYQVQNPEAEQPTVSLQEVTLGVRKKGLAEITQGLATDDVIVTHGTLRLSEGSAVMIQAYDNGEPLIDLLSATAQKEK